MKKLLYLVVFLAFPLAVHANSCTIVYSGNSYSTLYPCGHCPGSVGGGVTRRGTVINKLRSQTKNLLTLDSGNFSGSDPLDTRLAPEIEKKKTLAYYRIMDALGYDAACVGESEFKFGVDFLKERISQAKFKLVSANITLEGVVPYVIKDFGNLKVAITGLTPQNVSKNTGVSVSDYEQALLSVLDQIKKKTNFVILLSSLGDQETDNIARKFPQINLVILSGNTVNNPPPEKHIIGKTTLLWPYVLSKRVNIAEITNDKGEINLKSLKLESLARTVKEDPEISKILPACFMNTDCPAKNGLVTVCENSCETSARCIYIEPDKIQATIISNTACPYCVTDSTQDILKDMIPGLTFSVIDYKDTEAKKLIDAYGLETLPAFILPAEIKKSQNYPKIKTFFVEKNGTFLANKQLSGIFLFLKRKEVPGRIDYFLDMGNADSVSVAGELIKFTETHKVVLEIIMIMDPDTKKNPPSEEVKVALAVKKLYPSRFRKYIMERLKEAKTSPWIDTLESMQLDYKKIKPVLKSAEIEMLISTNNQIAGSAGVNEGNVIIVNNTMLFKVFQISEEELIKFFKR